MLHGLDFHVADGEIVVILGANGAGKTTTLRAVSGMIPRTGSVMLRGEDITSMREESSARDAAAPAADEPTKKAEEGEGRAEGGRPAEGFAY